MDKLNLKRKKYENMVVCIHGPGLVGPIVGEYFVEYGNFKYSGTFKFFQKNPISIVIKGKPLPTVRIYESNKNILVMIDQDLKGILLKRVFKNLKDLYKKYKINRVIIVNGIENPKREIFYISNKEKILSKKINDGVVIGIPALFLLDDETNSIFLLVGVQNPDMDPNSALIMINYLKDLLKEEIDTKPLEKEIEQYMKILEEAKITEEKETQLERMIFR